MENTLTLALSQWQLGGFIESSWMPPIKTRVLD
jgi:hypothetical protein